MMIMTSCLMHIESKDDDEDIINAKHNVREEKVEGKIGQS